MAPRSASLALCCVLGLAGAARAQQPDTAGTPAVAVGDSLTDFRQREPDQGAPATERTVVTLAREGDVLIVMVRAEDRDMTHVSASELRRDADLSGDDHVEILIDSFHDRRSAFVFGTNPNGAMWDAQLVGIDDLNADWNGVWDVTVRRDARAWTAVFRIPLRTLRFHGGADLRFGFNVLRFIRRKNEEDLWRGWGRAQGLYEQLQEGDVTNLGASPAGRGVDVYPYILTRAVEADHDSSGARTGGDFVGAKAGVDAKITLTPTLTADLTVATDFAQVEADQQVINLTRVPFFFPEKREFFLESSGLFDFATPGRVEPFYSRRIGLDTAGGTVPILGGARLYGRAGAWRLGVLDVETGGPADANDAVVRVQHDLLDRSYVGAIATLQTGAASAARSASGLDVDLPLVVHGQNVEPKFWIIGSRAPGVPGTPLAWRLSTDNPNDLFDNFVSLYHIDSGYTAPLGFVQRTGVLETTGHSDVQPRPHALGIRQLDFEVIPSWDVVAQVAGSLTRVRDWEAAEFVWVAAADRDNGDHVELNFQRLADAPPDTFPIFRDVTVPPGRYWWSRYVAQYEMSPGRPFGVSGIVNWGTFYGGKSTAFDITATWRRGGHLILSQDVTRTAARLPAGTFTAVVAATRIETDFDPRTSLLGFIQYDNETRRVDFNVRFHWIPVIGDDVYLVWNSGYTTDPASPFQFPRGGAWGRPLNGAFVVKAVHRLAP